MNSVQAGSGPSGDTGKKVTSRWGAWARLVVAATLLGLIFHVIFCNEAQLHLSTTGQSWEALGKWDQRRLAWSRGPLELWRTFGRLSAQHWLVALGCCGIPVILGGLRWRRALRVQGLDVGVGAVIRVSFVAHFFNAFLLGSTGGDVVKAWCASRWTRERRAEAALTVLVDRLVGTLALLVFAVAMIPLAWRAPDGTGLFLAHSSYPAVAVLVGSMAAVAAGLVLAAFHTDWLAAGSAAARMLGRLPRGESLARALAACRLFGRDRTYLPVAAAYSIVINVAIVGTFLAIASGIGLEVPARVLWFVVPAVVCIAALPVTPSGLGVRENLLVSLLALPEFPGVRHGEALALALLAYSANLAWSAIGGLVYLLKPSPSGTTD